MGGFAENSVMLIFSVIFKGRKTENPKIVVNESIFSTIRVVLQFMLF